MKRRPKAALKPLAARARVEISFIEECVELGFLQINAPPEDASQLARLRRLRRVCRALELDAYAGGIIVELLERLAQLERELERLRPRT